MLMLPITFLPASGLALLALWLLSQRANLFHAPWLIAFLACLALQLFLLGARFGYGVEGVLSVQHITGVLIPPLAYLAFTNPPRSARLLRHILPLLAIGAALLFAPSLLDTILAAVTLGYAAALTRLLRADTDSIAAWAPLRYTHVLRWGAWATVAALLLSGFTDAIIAVDFFATGGRQTPAIAATASLGGVALLIISAAMLLRSGPAKQTAVDTSQDADLVQKLTTLLTKKELFRDPDLTLGRLAKRTGLPTRHISGAVNRHTGLNVSQFVNTIRIEAACEALSLTDISVTNAMLNAGFYTKSNFNREFRRVTGKSPTQWRSALFKTP